MGGLLKKRPFSGISFVTWFFLTAFCLALLCTYLYTRVSRESPDEDSLRKARCLWLLMKDELVSEEGRDSCSYSIAFSGRAKSSTDFLKWALTVQMSEEEFLRTLYLPGVPRVATLAEFTSDNNAWCVVTTKNTLEPHNLPLYISRNAPLTTELVRSANPNQLLKLDPTATPFGNKFILFVTYGGNVRILPGPFIRIGDIFPDEILLIKGIEVWRP